MAADLPAPAWVDVSGRGEEPGAVAQLDFLVIPDLAVGVAGYHLEQVAVRPDRRLREEAELLAGHLRDIDLVVNSVNLDRDPFRSMSTSCFVRHTPSLVALLPPRYHATELPCIEQPVWHDEIVKPAKAMTIRLSTDQADELETVAAVDDQPVSEVIRVAISAHIAQRKQDEDFQQGLRARIERAQRMLGERRP
jgi:hypothetical protein